MTRISKSDYENMGGMQSGKVTSKFISGRWHYYRID